MNVFMDCPEKAPHFRCVWCEHPSDSLFVRYTSSVVKLQSCGNCGNHVDQYVEYDHLGIFLDILLQKREAYRHVLFNSGYKILWRFLLVVVMADAYANWISWRAKDSEFSEALSVDLLEWEFQKRLLNSALVHLLFLLSSALIGCGRHWLLRKHGSSKVTTSFGFFLNGMIVSLFAVVLKVPAVIWTTSSQLPYSMFWGCWVLQLISSRQVYSILSHTAALEAFLTVACLMGSCLEAVISDVVRSTVVSDLAL
ncbi:hypothetical protein BV898_16120 [Hypsibius exemplaris]|uniref:Protein ARV n=1 Tax=Hypsibius exemplaris TaxID=2072580 RepID=A0A9X6NCK0_HYPEX|nr:hypothetical protein BV898_16120 [Hypsibius exemplaris]